MQPGKSGGSGQKPDGEGGRHKKRVRQPHNTAERQKQKMVGRGEFIIDQTNSTMLGDNSSYQDSGYASTAAPPGGGAQGQHDMMNVNGVHDPSQQFNHDRQNQRPNSIEINRAYEQQQQQLQERMAAANLNSNSNGCDL